jgi:alpha-ketoglutarate-dependent taurine dioxygenase
MQELQSRLLDRGTTWSPLVFECPDERRRDLATLEKFVRDNASQIHADIARHGAVIFRGFPVASAAQFERVLGAIPGFVPIAETFMCQPGRVLTHGAQFVFETDVTTVTGGAFSFGFHSEHYFSPDVPAYHCFAALSAPRFAGETALVKTSRVFEELPEDLKRRLRQTAVACAAWPIAKVARRYLIDEFRLEQFCRSAGLHVGVIDGQPSIIMMKPTVWRHPVTGKECLQANLSISLRGLDRDLRDLFRATTYSAPVWSLHRLIWKYQLNVLAETISAFLHHTQQGNIFTGLKQAAYISLWELATRVERLLGRPEPLPDATRSETHRLVHGVTDESDSRYLPALSDCFKSDEEVELLARAIHKHMVLVKWEDGDILLLDNRQTLHSGMPGFLSPRDLKVIMCNPIPWEASRTGLRDIPDSGKCTETLVSRLARFLGR